jgi:hypothetical protein
LWGIAIDRKVAIAQAVKPVTSCAALHSEGRHVLTGAGWNWETGKHRVHDDFALRVWERPAIAPAALRSP